MKLFKFDRNFWMYTGAFLFSIITFIWVHEAGHYLAFRWKGYQAVSIRITPFFGSTNSIQDIRIEDAPSIILGGTIFNLTVASLITVIFRFTKSPFFLPIRMVAPMAFLVEGVVIIAGLFYEETVTDFALLNSLGWSQFFICVLGVLFILIGGYLCYEVWVLFGDERANSTRALLFLNLPYILYFLAGYLLCQLLLPPELSSIKKLLAISMFIHWAYLGIRIALAPYILPLIQKNQPRLHSKITSRSSNFSMLMGGAFWLISIVMMN